LPQRIKKRKGKTRERGGGREKEKLRFFQIVKSKIAVTLVWRRYQRCFHSVARKEKKKKGREAREEGGGDEYYIPSGTIRFKQYWFSIMV